MVKGIAIQNAIGAHFTPNTYYGFAQFVCTCVYVFPLYT